MKYIYIILIALMCFKSSAQDPQLFENTWYLQNVIVDDQDNFPPSNDEVPYVDLLFFENDLFLATNVCNNGSGPVDFNNANSSFVFTDGLTITLSDCDNPINTIFEGVYFQDYFNAGYITVNDVFFYDIIDNGNSNYTLNITSPSGDQAIYGNQILSNTDFKDLQFAVYPNPTSDVINIEGNSQIEKVVIYDLLGRNVLETSPMAEKTQINISSLNNGVYLVSIISEGKRTVRKIVKE